MKSEMTHRERILASFKHEPTDRVATDFWGVPEIKAKLIKHFGVTNFADMCAEMDIDLILELDVPLLPGRDNMWGLDMKIIPIAGGAGTYEEPKFFPIEKFETIEEVDEKYVWPTTDMYDYNGLKEQVAAAEKHNFAIMGGYIAPFYYYGLIRGVEQMFMDLMLEPELAHHILKRIHDFSRGHIERIFEVCKGKIDCTQVTEDLGSQNGLLMHMDMVDEYMGKIYDERIAFAKANNAVVFHHDDGAMTEALPWLMKKGIEVLNPLQWHLPGWNLKELKKTYGEKLCFHGGIDNQYVLPFGTEAEVRKEVRDCMDALYTDRTGFIVAPCHNAQAMTPVENVLAMYDEARKYSSMF